VTLAGKYYNLKALASRTECSTSAVYSAKTADTAITKCMIVVMHIYKWLHFEWQ